MPEPSRLPATPGARTGTSRRSPSSLRRLGTVLLAALLCSVSHGAVAAPVPTAASASTSSPIQDHYSQLGGAGGLLGAETRAESALADGSYAAYQNGVIYYSPATGAWEVHGGILTDWSALGAQRSVVGYPTSDERVTPDGAGRYNLFAKGSIYWSAQSGANEVHGGIGAKWAGFGSQAGFLGYPLTNELATSDGRGRYNVFQGGWVYWSPTTGTYEVHGGVLGKWSSLGSETGVLGYPTSDENRTRDGVGRYNTFQSGAVYWSPATGSKAVVGAILARWQSMGAETGSLGYPVSDEYAVSGGRRSDFQNGSITWDAASGATIATTPAGGCTTAKGCEIIRIAASLTGIPYRYGGTTPSGFDCSGYTGYVYAKAGIAIPRTAEQQRVASTRVSNPVPGDLIFFGYPAYHVGVYAGGGKLYDSQRTGTYSGLHDIWTSTNVSYGRY